MGIRILATVSKATALFSRAVSKELRLPDRFHLASTLAASFVIQCTTEELVSFICELEWRPDRVEHIARHAVTPEEVEEALFGDVGGQLLRVGPAERNPEETIYRYVGRTEAGRYLLIVLLYLGDGRALPITARDMTRKGKRKFDA